MLIAQLQLKQYEKYTIPDVPGLRYAFSPLDIIMNKGVEPFFGMYSRHPS